MKQLFVVVLLCCLLAAVAEGARLRDPTRPPDYQDPNMSVVGKESLKVNTIIYSKSRKIAVVNGETLQVGDKIAGFEVLSITPHAVRFKGDEGEFDLSLLQQDIKTRIKQKGEL